jgi:Carboxypeptidase regulatory-like domain
MMTDDDLFRPSHWEASKMKQVALRTLLLGSACALFACTAAHAQSIYGGIYGTVTDPQGAVVPNATITITDELKGTSSSAQSNASGEWKIDNLIPDTYTVKVDASGFAEATATGILVHADDLQKADLALAPSGSKTTVTVSAEDVPLLKTDGADVSSVIDQHQIEDLPNLNRNLTQLEALVPGMQSVGSPQGVENPQSAETFDSNGSGYGEQGFYIDGTDNREPVLGIIIVNPNMDSVAEMKVITQNPDAEFGGAAGGAVSVITKSGTNDVHGSAFWNRESNANLARNPFNQYAPDPVTHRYIPGGIRSIFGGSVGGPIIKNKAFFFTDYQGMRQRVGGSFVTNVPTNLVRTTCLSGGTGYCNLSEYTTQPLYNPGTGVTYTNGLIPLSDIAPQAVYLLSQFPAPNSPVATTTNNLTGSSQGIQNSDLPDLRLDYKVSDKINVFARYDYELFHERGEPILGAAGGGSVSDTPGLSVGQNQSAAAGLDWVVNPSLISDVRFGFSSYHINEDSLQDGTSPAAQAGIPNLNVSPDTDGPPSYNLGGQIPGPSSFGRQDCNCPLLQSEQIFQVVNNWTKIVGTHSFKFGADLRYAKNIRNPSDQNRAGNLNFDDATTSVYDAATSSYLSPGLDLATLLLGYISNFQRLDLFIVQRYSYQKRDAFFGQDSWRVTPKLTVNYGVRWDLVFPETVNGHGLGSFASLKTGSWQVLGVGPFGSNGGQKMQYLNLGGRLAFNYQIRPTTVIRGGVGTVYDTTGFYGLLFNNLSLTLPGVATESIYPNTGNFDTYVGTLSSPPVRATEQPVPASGLIPFSSNNAPSIRGDRIEVSKVDQYNLAIQQQFGRNLTADIAYVGNLGEHVYLGNSAGGDLNPPLTLPTSPAQLQNTAPLRPYYNYFNATYNGQLYTCCNGSIGDSMPSGRMEYNGLQTKLTKRMASGVQVSANFTWSKTMRFDGNDNYFTQYRQEGWTRSENDIPKVFVVNGIAELPFGKNHLFLSNSGPVVNTIAGGWSITGITTWETGYPFNVYYAECGEDQEYTCYPNGRVSGIPMSAGPFDPILHRVKYFTKAPPLTYNGETALNGAVSRPAFGTMGDLANNPFITPRQFFTDASLIKKFSIRERLNGEFRFETYNLFNHMVYGGPDSSIDGTEASAGYIYGTNGNPRQLQFSARFTF